MDIPENKRREPRLSDEIAVFIEMQTTPSADSKPEFCITKTLDISAHGVKVLLDAELPLNSFHQLCFEISPKRFLLVGQVAWVAQCPEGVAIGFALMDSAQTQFTAWQHYMAERLQSD